jgi:hypothetical protein
MVDSVLDTDPEQIAETVDYVAIRRLQSAYADVVTRRAWSELAELFRPDARIEVDTRRDEILVFDGPGALGTFIAGAIERFGFFEFVILNTRIEIGVGGDPDAAAGRMYMCELRTDAASGEWDNAFGVYHDGYRRHDGRWRFEHRTYHSLARTADATNRVDVFAFPHHLGLGDA